MKISNPYRIVHITTVPKTFGQLTDQLKYFGNHGFEVYCISSPGHFLDIIFQQENVKTFAVPMNRYISPLHDLIALIRIFIILTKIKLHIVYGSSPKGGLLGIVAATVARVPIRIYHIYGLRFTTMKGWRRNIVYLAEKFTSFCATNIYSCVSTKICLEFKNLDFFHKSRKVFCTCFTRNVLSSNVLVEIRQLV